MWIRILLASVFVLLASCASNGRNYIEPEGGPYGQSTFEHETAVPGIGVLAHEGENCVNPRVVIAQEEKNVQRTYKFPANELVTLFVRAGKESTPVESGWNCVTGGSFRPVEGGRYRFKMSRAANQCHLVAYQLKRNDQWGAIPDYRERKYRTPSDDSEGYCEPSKSVVGKNTN